MDEGLVCGNEIDAVAWADAKARTVCWSRFWRRMRKTFAVPSLSKAVTVSKSYTSTYCTSSLPEEYAQRLVMLTLIIVSRLRSRLRFVNWLS